MLLKSQANRKRQNVDRRFLFEDDRREEESYVRELFARCWKCQISVLKESKKANE